MTHQMLTAFDGNNSLRLVDGAHRRGTSTEVEELSTSIADFWLTEEHVDQFKDEVTSKAKGKKGKGREAMEVVGAAEVGEEGDDDDDDGWTKARQEATRKRMRL
jgi:hypothetical protein